MRLGYHQCPVGSSQSVDGVKFKAWSAIDENDVVALQVLRECFLEPVLAAVFGMQLLDGLSCVGVGRDNREASQMPSTSTSRRFSPSSTSANVSWSCSTLSAERRPLRFPWGIRINGQDPLSSLSQCSRQTVGF